MKKINKLNEKNIEYIFEILLQDYQEGINLIKNKYENYENILNDLKNGKLLNSYKETFLECFIEKISFNYQDYNEARDYILSIKNNKDYSINEKGLSITYFERLENELKNLKGEGFDFQNPKFNVSNYIKHPVVLMLFLDIGLEIDFSKELLKNNLVAPYYEDIINFKIPEMICGKDNVRNFGKIFFKDTINEILEKAILRNDNTNLSKLVNEYGVKLNEQLLNKTLLNIGSQLLFDTLESQEPDLIKKFFNSKYQDNKESFSENFCNSTMSYVSKKFNSDYINWYIKKVVFRRHWNTPSIFKKAVKVFGEEKIKENYKNSSFNIDDMFDLPGLKGFSYYEVFGKMGIISQNKKEGLYLNNIVKIKTFNKEYIEKIAQPIIKNYKYCLKPISYLEIQYGHLINEIENNNPQKICYCNKYVFESAYKNKLDLAIKELEKKYPNYNVNKEDDYGFTIADYFFQNMVTSKMNLIWKKNEKYCYTPTNLFKSNDTQECFLKGCLSLFKNKYNFNNELLKSMEELNEDLYSKLKPYIENHIIKKDILSKNNKKINHKLNVI